MAVIFGFRFIFLERKVTGPFSPYAIRKAMTKGESMGSPYLMTAKETDSMMMKYKKWMMNALRFSVFNSCILH